MRLPLETLGRCRETLSFPEFIHLGHYCQDIVAVFSKHDKVILNIITNCKPLSQLLAQNIILNYVLHFTGLAVGVGLFTTFLYVNKNIQTQVFLQVSSEQKNTFFNSLYFFVNTSITMCFCVFPQDRHSKLQCVWLLVFLTSSTLLLYYTFLSETLHYW